MVDTPRTRADLQTLWADNSSGDISPQDLRDGLLSTPSSYVNVQTGTTYTFVLADANGTVTHSNGAASTLTVPPNADVAFPVGTKLRVWRLGAGLPTFAAGVGVTLNLPTGIPPNRRMGVRAYMTSDDTTVNATAGYTLSFDATDTDTDGFWSAGAPTRLTIPSGLGIKHVRAFSTCRPAAATADTNAYLLLRHSNSGATVLSMSGSGAERGGPTTFWDNISLSVPVTAADYFSTDLTQETDTSITITAATFQSSLGLEVTAINPVGSIAFQYGWIELEQVAANIWCISGPALG